MFADGAVRVAGSFEMSVDRPIAHAALRTPDAIATAPHAVVAQQNETELMSQHPTIIERGLSKVPEVTLVFWIIKIAATTLGETGGDALSMSLDLGYLASSAILILIFIVAVAIQIMVRRYHPALYWLVIIATTTAGTTMADFADRSLGIDYPGGTLLLFALLIASLAIWYWSVGSVSVAKIASPKVEMFYWVTILFSQTLGTALGDWMAGDDRHGLGLGYEYGALIFAAGLAIVVALYYFTSVSRVLLFWLAFILTRPLGATVGDLLDKPVANGGFAVDRFYASAGLAVFIVLCLIFLPQKAGLHPVETRGDATA